MESVTLPERGQAAAMVHRFPTIARDWRPSAGQLSETACQSASRGHRAHGAAHPHSTYVGHRAENSRAPGEALSKLRRVCGEFEGFFLAYLMRIMRRASLRSDFLSGGLPMDIFMDQFFSAIGKRLGEAGGIGIGRMLYEQLAPMVAPSTANPSPAERPNGNRSELVNDSKSSAPNTKS